MQTRKNRIIAIRIGDIGPESRWLQLGNKAGSDELMSRLEVSVAPLMDHERFERII